MEHTVNIDQWLNVGRLKSIYHNGENGIVMYIPTRTRTCIYGYTLHTTTQSHTGFDHNATKCVRCHIKIYCEWMTLCIWLSHICMAVSFSHPRKSDYMENWFYVCACGIFAVSNTFHFWICVFFSLSLFILLLPFRKCNKYRSM